MPEPISRPNYTAADSLTSYGPEDTSSAEKPAVSGPPPVVTEQWLVDRVKTSGPRPRHLENVEVARPRTTQDVAQCKSLIANPLAGTAALLAGAIGKTPMAAAIGGVAGKIAADAIAAMICDPPATGKPARSPDAPAPAPNEPAR